MKDRTDLDLLYRAIEPSLSSSEFFLRKAIGWALRQYAWTNPKEVARYVRAHEKELSPLSRREALKNIGKGSKWLLRGAALLCRGSIEPCRRRLATTSKKVWQ